MRDKNFGIRHLMGVDFSMTGRISDSVMRRMIESQHAAQYGSRLLRPMPLIQYSTEAPGDIVFRQLVAWIGEDLRGVPYFDQLA